MILFSSVPFIAQLRQLILKSDILYNRKLQLSIRDQLKARTAVTSDSCVMKDLDKGCSKDDGRQLGQPKNLFIHIN